MSAVVSGDVSRWRTEEVQLQVQRVPDMQSPYSKQMFVPRIVTLRYERNDDLEWIIHTVRVYGPRRLVNGERGKNWIDRTWRSRLGGPGELEVWVRELITLYCPQEEGVK